MPNQTPPSDESTPVDPGQRRTRWWPRPLAELPLVAGIGAGLYLLWLWGAAFVIHDHPVGVQWHDYLRLAWHLFHGAPDAGEDWRAPLYFLLLGHWGERGDYVAAAILIASLSAAAMVAAAGIAGRAAGGPWAGGLAALSVPAVQVTAESAQWATFYPLLGAGTGLALAFGACLARWPGITLALLAGAGTALAWGADGRGILILPAMLLLLGLAVVRVLRPSKPPSHPPRPWRRPVLVAPALVVAFGAGLASHGLIPERTDVRPVTLERQIDYQLNEFRYQMIEQTRQGRVVEPCRAEQTDSLTPWVALTGTCAGALFRHNVSDTLPRQIPFPLWAMLVALGLAMLPGGLGWRGSALSVALVGAPAALLALQCLWLPVPDRYYLQFAVPVALVVPLALARLPGTLVPRRFRGWGIAVAVAAGVPWLLLSDGLPSRVPTGIHDRPPTPVLREALADLEERLGPGDHLYDCTELYLEIARLPDIRRPAPHTPAYRSEEFCRSWMADPGESEGTIWLATGRQDTPAILGLDGWTRVKRIPGMGPEYQLWRWGG